jgi:hypothetical protein
MEPFARSVKIIVRKFRTAFEQQSVARTSRSGNSFLSQKVSLVRKGTLLKSMRASNLHNLSFRHLLVQIPNKIFSAIGHQSLRGSDSLC